ncbi:Ig-like domain-containing protein [Acanthopleuribacter pedis]|uniref:Tandem-95 repeat protein n=1 Tax=Acanthopleuribacter pedis TaxID=442870 RepID=A0A8J7U1P1_9BACT|nr:Ig-like domain-containing protein [Acanthopleuribacter pedis]MBO1317732.1 tandem-95 repeat protein [Acanthopleuribacter pedis]
MKKPLASLVFALFAFTAAWAQTETTAYEDRYTTTWDQTLHVAAPGLLQNDHSAAGGLTAFLAEAPQAGTLSLNVDGSFDFSPTDGLQGPVTFVYGVEDQQGSTGYATVTIQVNPGNKAPLAVADYYSVAAGQTLTVPAAGVLANDIDLDGDTLTASILTAPQSGVISLQEDGGFSYEAAADASGDHRFTYRVSDSAGAQSEGVAFITVTSASLPEAVADTFSVTAGAGADLDVLANDSDPDGNSLTVVAATQPTEGDVSFDESGVRYTAPADFEGRTQFSYTVSDGVFRATAMVTVDVTGGNLPPVVVDDRHDIPRHMPLFFDPLGNDYDPNGDELTMTWLSEAQHGALSQTPHEWVYQPGDSRENVQEVLDYEVFDGVNRVVGQVVINITGNHAPEANDDSYTVYVNPRFPTRLPLTANDRDIDGDRLTISRFTSVGSSNLYVIPYGDDQTLMATAIRGGTFTFTYWVTDGILEDSATVTITVPGPGASVANDDAYTLRVGESLRLNTFANDVYYGHNPYRAPEHTNPGHGALIWANGDWTYMHMSGQAAETSFTYTLPGGSTATVNLTILPNE